MTMTKKSPRTEGAVVRDTSEQATVTLDMGAPAEAPPVETAPVEAEPEPLPENVPVATSKAHPRTPRYRVLKSKVLHWRAQELRFKEGDVFGFDTFGPDAPYALKAFEEAGLELEQIE